QCNQKRRTDASLRIKIRRSHVWEDVKVKLNKYLEEDHEQGIHVQYVSEPAVDTGGPKRELFSVLHKHMNDSNSMFAGESNTTISFMAVWKRLQFQLKMFQMQKLGKNVRNSKELEIQKISNNWLHLIVPCPSRLVTQMLMGECSKSVKSRLTAETVDDLFEVQFSHEGGNNHQQEEVIAFHFTTLTEHIEIGAIKGQVFHFSTESSTESTLVDCELAANDKIRLVMKNTKGFGDVFNNLN
ncbi:G2 M phase-specific E3 ubiquitin- ligase-like, partial [Paramuricea clavata]